MNKMTDRNKVIIKCEILFCCALPELMFKVKVSLHLTS